VKALAAADDFGGGRGHGAIVAASMRLGHLRFLKGSSAIRVATSAG
jgi:hypothetical protein